MHTSWTLKWIPQDAAQSQPQSTTPRIAAVCCGSQVLCTTAVTCADSICWLTPPLVPAEPADLVISFLLQQLRELLFDNGCERLLLLTDPAEDNRRLQHCLTTAGFQRLAGIAQFQLTADCATKLSRQSAANLNIEVIHLRQDLPAMPQDKLQALQSLVTAAIADSRDLSRLPTPGFQQQWKDWQHASATILAAVNAAAQYTGLCVLAENSDACPLPDTCRMKILWLAVRPDCRRNGIASMLLRSAAEFLMTSPDTGHPVSLAADVDLENPAALELYSNCGFHRCNRTLELWGT